jgi:redox-sensitive bicupin YhaK (pirin superfamily)
MSWMPSNDPILGERRSCEALELVIVPRARDLGGFAVRRALPHGKRQMVGPFIFFDAMGPVVFPIGQGMDVRPHPHIGLATVTYLFAGEIMHRDSEGNALEITPGAMNLMTAGRGIVHSERTPQSARQGGGRVFGIQSWIALPQAHEETEPSFQHFDSASLPVVESDGVRARIIVGSAFGRRSPVGMLSEWLYAEVLLDAGSSAPLDADHEERAIYVVDGEVTISGESFEGPRLLIFRPGDAITVHALRRTRTMFLGGAAMDGPRHIWWNFVSSRRERIEQAKEDWKAGRFPAVPGES